MANTDLTLTAAPEWGPRNAIDSGICESCARAWEIVQDTSAECPGGPMGWWGDGMGSDYVAIVPVDCARGFADDAWMIPDDLEHSEILEWCDYPADAIGLHFGRAGWAWDVYDYSGYDMWATYVVATRPGEGPTPSQVAETVNAWLSGDVYQVNVYALYAYGEMLQWQYVDAMGGVYMDLDDGNEVTQVVSDACAYADAPTTISLDRRGLCKADRVDDDDDLRAFCPRLAEEVA